MSRYILLLSLFKLIINFGTCIRFIQDIFTDNVSIQIKLRVVFMQGNQNLT